MTRLLRSETGFAVVLAAVSLAATAHGAGAAWNQDALSGVMEAARPWQSGQKPPAEAAKPAAQTAKPAAAAQPDRGAQTPEQKAYTEAVKIADPDKKIEALEKLIADFPKSTYAENAETQILAALIKKTTDQIAKIKERAKSLAAKGGDGVRGSRAGSVATQLLNANLLLEDAEQYALEGLKAFEDERAYIDRQKQAFEERQAEARKNNPDAKPLTAPPDTQLATMFTSQRQSALLTLAQIYDKRGKAVDAERRFKEVYDLNPKGPSGATSATKLAGYAKAAGRDRDHLEYLTVAALSGRLDRAGRAELEEAYRKGNGGTDGGLDAMLDERYRRENPNPVTVTPYLRAKGRTDRIVLGEVFTGSGCPPCVGADLAFDAAMERYAPSELAVLVYHLHIPRPDPMTNPSTRKRQEFYAVRGVPTFAINGQAIVGGGSADAAPGIYKDKIVPVVDKALTTRAGARVRLTASQTGSMVSVKAEVGRPSAPARKVRLHVVLAEESVSYSGENGIRFHSMVVRSVAAADDGAQGFAVSPSKPLKVEHAFDLDRIVAEAKAHLDDFEKNNDRFGVFEFTAKKHALDRSRLAVVAFLQDEETKEVLQAAQVKLGGRAPAGH